MSKYIKLYDAIMAMDEWFCEPITPTKILSDLPTIDIVHCKDCKRWIGDSEWYEDREYKRCQNGGLLTAPNHYCAWGERIDNE